MNTVNTTTEEVESESVYADSLLAGSYPAWISVEDRLPPNEDFVLAVVNGSYKVPGMNVTFVNGMVIASWFGDFGGWDLDGYPEHDPEQLKVTHWMPLPEPPKEEET
jgi:hypothetical protein